MSDEEIEHNIDNEDTGQGEYTGQSEYTDDEDEHDENYQEPSPFQPGRKRKAADQPVSDE